MSWGVSGPAHQVSLPGSLKMPSFGSLPESSGRARRAPTASVPWQRRRNAMRWFRSRARLGSGLALFALVAQLTLSFGHLHADASARDLGVSAAASNMPPSADQTPAVVQRASTAPAAALASRVAQRNGDVGGAHEAVLSGMATLLRRLRRRCSAGGTSPSEVDRRGALRRACAHFRASAHR